MVTYNGSTYEATAAIPASAVTPDQNSAWALFAQAGAIGAAGSAGATGATGATGAQGPAGTNGTNGAPGAPGVGFLFLGAWVSGTSYVANDVVTENGNSYVETAANLPNDATDPATDTTNWSLMAVGFNFRSAWVSGTTYAINDVVTEYGNSYVAVAPLPNDATDPATDTANWSLMAQAGTAGAAGAPGPQGPQGLTGLTGSAGPQGPQGLTGAIGPQGPAGTNGTGFKFTGAFNPSGPYNQYDVATYYGSTYVANAAIPAASGTTNPVPPQSTSWTLVTQGFNFTGPFVPAGTYNPYDVVAYNGSVYIATTAVQANQNTPDQNTANWALFVQQGATGPQGTAGPTGATGPQGPTGPAGAKGATGATGATGAAGAQGPVGPSRAYFKSMSSGPYPCLAANQGDGTNECLTALTLPAGSYVVIANAQIAITSSGQSESCEIEPGGTHSAYVTMYSTGYIEASAVEAFNLGSTTTVQYVCGGDACLAGGDTTAILVGST